MKKFFSSVMAILGLAAILVSEASASQADSQTPQDAPPHTEALCPGW